MRDLTNFGGYQNKFGFFPVCCVTLSQHSIPHLTLVKLKGEAPKALESGHCYY